MSAVHLDVRQLTMAYEDLVVQRNLDFSVSRGEIFIIVGGSGCGKSTLLRHLIGLQQPISGSIHYEDRDFWALDNRERRRLLSRWGILYQGGALFSSMTLAENVAVPLREYTGLDPTAIAEQVQLKLALVGLTGFENYYPAELSGGMQKRAGLARALALDPDLLFFDEPSAGLDPISSRNLDELILELRASLGTTVVVVSHELASIFAIADRILFLDTQEKRQLALGPPGELRQSCPDPRVRRFLSRGRL